MELYQPGIKLLPQSQTDLGGVPQLWLDVRELFQLARAELVGLGLHVLNAPRCLFCAVKVQIFLTLYVFASAASEDVSFLVCNVQLLYCAVIKVMIP